MLHDVVYLSFIQHDLIQCWLGELQHQAFIKPNAVVFSVKCCDNTVMMTSSNGHIFRVTGHLCRERQLTWSFDVFFDLRPNKRLSKQPWGWWLETLSRPLWRHRNVLSHLHKLAGQCCMELSAVSRNLLRPILLTWFNINLSLVK